MTPYGNTLAIGGCVILVAGIVALTWIVARATTAAQLHTTRARAERAEHALAQALSAQHRTYRPHRNLPRRGPVPAPLDVPAGLFEEADQILAAGGDAETVIMQGMSPRAWAVYEQLRRRQP
jgi:hypothetical protein